jgi:hypothetical protein
MERRYRTFAGLARWHDFCLPTRRTRDEGIYSQPTRPCLERRR